VNVGLIILGTGVCITGANVGPFVTMLGRIVVTGAITISGILGVAVNNTFFNEGECVIGA
jgi:hypothetical protein